MRATHAFALASWRLDASRGHDATVDSVARFGDPVGANVEWERSLGRRLWAGEMGANRTRIMDADKGDDR